MTNHEDTAPPADAPFEQPVTTLQRYLDADDALTYHERPFYRACAGGPYFERTDAWEKKRAKLTTDWYAAEAAAFGRPMAQKPTPGLLRRIGAWLRRNTSDEPRRSAASDSITELG